MNKEVEKEVSNNGGDMNNDIVDNSESTNNETTSKETYTFETWEDDNLGIKLNLLRGIFAHGFDKPSNIQRQAILPLIKKRDVIAQAQSGTGKTGTFSIGVLQHIDETKPETQVIIMEPTRELAKQSYEVIKNIGTYMKINMELLIGGTNIDACKASIDANTPHIIVGCPGRINDMIRRSYINISNVNLIILDEADEMLSSGFKEQVYNILEKMNETIQLGLFSATIPSDLWELIGEFMRNPYKILVNKEELTLRGIKQYYIALDSDEHKYSTLKDIYDKLSISQSIIYCNSIRRTNDLYEAMQQDNFPVGVIHSGLTGEERIKNYEDFKIGKTRVLIATDVLARGIDVQTVKIVINFDLCKNIHTYIHRIGRSGRYGRKGVGINFVTQRDVHKMKEIQSFYNTEVTEMPIDFESFITT